MDKGQQTVSLQEAADFTGLEGGFRKDSPQAQWIRFLIRSFKAIYSLFISPILHIFGGASAGACRYPKSCSQYAEEALLERGLIKGSFLSLLRILSCNPWMRPQARLMQVQPTRFSHKGKQA